MFRPFVTGSDESGLDNVTGKFGFPTPLRPCVIAHITLDSVKFCLSLTKFDYLRGLWNEVLHQ